MPRSGTDAVSTEQNPPAVSSRLARWFGRYLRRYFARHFDAIRLSGEEGLATIGDAPLVIYTNHPSWWDPILFMLLSQEVFPDKTAYGPMDSAALEKYGFLTKLGVFGVEQGTRAGVIQFLRMGESILKSDGSTLWITAEGRFTDPRRRPVDLRPGLSHLVRRVGKVTAIPLAVEYTFWNERLPEILVRFGESVDFTEADRSKSVTEITQRLNRNLESTLDELESLAVERDPCLFRTLLLGRSGIGGIYDSWRRLKANAQGKSFDASHGGRGS